MNGLLTFCVFFFFCAACSAAAARLIFLLIQPGELFSGWRVVLRRLDTKHTQFLYKRLGGCIVCTRQMLADISFIILCLVFCTYFRWPVHRIHFDYGFWQWVLRILIDFGVYVTYSALVLTIGQIIDQYMKPKQIEEDIVHSTAVPDGMPLQ